MEMDPIVIMEDHSGSSSSAGLIIPLIPIALTAAATALSRARPAVAASVFVATFRSFISDNMHELALHLTLGNLSVRYQATQSAKRGSLIAPTCPQSESRVSRAACAPPLIMPTSNAAAFGAPELMPEIAAISTRGSSNSRSSTPQVNAPCAPPPCSARLMRLIKALSNHHRR